MRRSITLTVALLVGIVAPHVRAEPFSWTEDFCVSATANVFDGGPAQSEEACGSGTNESGLALTASDHTRPGTLGATALAAVASNTATGPDVFGIRVDLITGYFPATTAGGDNPGGMAEAELHSVIEFEMPVDQLGWLYSLDIDNFQPNPFVGATSILVENVTRSEILLEMNAETPEVETVLVGAQGDLIRITSDMMGAGSMGPGSGKSYNTQVVMLFTIPEPGTLVTLAVGAAVLLRRKKST